MLGPIENSQAQVLCTNENGANQVPHPSEIDELGTSTQRDITFQTHINIIKNPSCRLLYRLVSKIDKRINPRAPAKAKKSDSMAHVLSKSPLFGTSWPACRSHRSDRKARSRKTTVMTLPVMNSGFAPSAPTSEMYLEKKFQGQYIILKERVHGMRTQWSGRYP